MSAQVAFTVSSEVLCSEVDGCLVLLNMENETYYSLNAVGSRVWRLLEQQVASPGIVEAMLEVYDVEEVRLQRDLDELLKRLSDAGLLRTSVPAPSTRCT